MKNESKKAILRTKAAQKIRLRIKLIIAGATALTGVIAFLAFFGAGNFGTPKMAKAAATTYTTIANGNWSSTSGVWSTNGGITGCSCAPSTGGNSDIIVIRHAINMNADISITSGGSIYISRTGSLINVTRKLEVQNGKFETDGTVSLRDILVRTGGTAVFNGSVTAANRFEVEGIAVFNSLTTVTTADLDFKSGSVNDAGDNWQINLPAGNVVNEGTLNFNGNIITILDGNFVNQQSGVVAGFGNIEAKSGSISNLGTWDTDVDWCASTNILSSGLADPENCLDTLSLANGTSCDNSYILDWKDPLTYTVTCGEVNSANWSVKGMTCWFYSPLFSTGGSIGGPNRIAEWTVRINQSGNVDSNDTASVHYYVNGTLVRTDSYPGIGSPAVFTSSRRILVPSGGTYQVRIRLLNDKTNELWQVKSDDVTACLLSPFNPPSVLPVTLISFTAKTINNKTVLLNWATATEVNNDYFTIERSATGNEFSELVRIEGIGNSTTLHKYAYTDEHPLGGTSYYRLKQTDFDGTTAVFKMVSVTITSRQDKTSLLRISPNPFTQSFTADFELAETQEVTIQLINVNGAIAFTENFMAQQGRNVYQFTTPYSLKPVTYHLRITNGREVLASTKVICKK